MRLLVLSPVVLLLPAEAEVARGGGDEADKDEGPDRWASGMPSCLSPPPADSPPPAISKTGGAVAGSCFEGWGGDD